MQFSASHVPTAPGRRSSRAARALAWSGLVLAAVALAGALLAALGHRWGWWHYEPAIAALLLAAGSGFFAALLGIVGAVLGLGRGAGAATFAAAAAAVVLGALAFVPPVQQALRARELPPIHDISTDMANPPRFVAILPLRHDAPNSPEYAGETIAAQQRLAYPDLAPLILSLPPGAAFARAEAALARLGWEVVAAAPAEGRIEATDTTFWFGFQDDVVIRIAALEGGTRIDVRSVSRVGRSDLGANAARIRRLLAELRD